MRYTTFVASVAAIAAGAAGPAALHAQGLRIAPRAGVFIAGANLAEVRQAAEDVRARMEGSFAVGLGLELGAENATGFRATLDYVTGTTITADGFGDAPTSENTMLAVVGDVVLRPIPRAIAVQPYLLAGAGVKRYDFDPRSIGGDIDDLFPADKTDFTLHGGAGLDIGLGPISIMAEVSDYISRFELEETEDTRTQHDVFATLGLRVRLF